MNGTNNGKIICRDVVEIKINYIYGELDHSKYVEVENHQIAVQGVMH